MWGNISPQEVESFFQHNVNFKQPDLKGYGEREKIVTGKSYVDEYQALTEWWKTAGEVPKYIISNYSQVGFAQVLEKICLVS